MDTRALSVAGRGPWRGVRGDDAGVASRDGVSAVLGRMSGVDRNGGLSVCDRGLDEQQDSCLAGIVTFSGFRSNVTNPRAFRDWQDRDCRTRR
jgi:hypothetical protein